MILQAKKAFSNPGKVCRFAMIKTKALRETVLWNYNYAALPGPKVKSGVPHDSGIQYGIIEEFKSRGLNIKDFIIDIKDYKQYMNNADYQSFPNYYDGGRAENFIEKSLEHYLAAKLLDLSNEDTYIDIANANSPMPEIYNSLYGCKVYRQDLLFPKGIHGNIIGGDAGDMQVDDGFATKMALHCSFEHFEQDADIRFIKEANRVLKHGGKLCILPLYLFNKYVILVDPLYLPRGCMNFDKDATLFCTKRWGNRHGRFYDCSNFISRIYNNLNGLKLTIYAVRNEKEVDPSCYVKFIMLLDKI